MPATASWKHTRRRFSCANRGASTGAAHACCLHLRCAPAPTRRAPDPAHCTPASRRQQRAPLRGARAAPAVPPTSARASRAPRCGVAARDNEAQSASQGPLLGRGTGAPQRTAHRMRRALITRRAMNSSLWRCTPRVSARRHAKHARARATPREGAPPVFRAAARQLALVLQQRSLLLQQLLVVLRQRRQCRLRGAGRQHSV
jgi:hypothetical protein